MWLFTNDGFISVVRPPRNPKTDGMLLVRARRRGEIEKVFPPEGTVGRIKVPYYSVERLLHRDYRFRTLLPIEVVAGVIAQRIASIEYGNFKDSIKDRRLHDAAAECWYVMHRYQSENDPPAPLRDRRKGGPRKPRPDEPVPA